MICFLKTSRNPSNQNRNQLLGLDGTEDRAKAILAHMSAEDAAAERGAGAHMLRTSLATAEPAVAAAAAAGAGGGGDGEGAEELEDHDDPFAQLAGAEGENDRSLVLTEGVAANLGKEDAAGPDEEDEDSMSELGLASSPEIVAASLAADRLSAAAAGGAASALAAAARSGAIGLPASSTTSVPTVATSTEAAAAAAAAVPPPSAATLADAARSIASGFARAEAAEAAGVATAEPKPPSLSPVRDDIDDAAEPHLGTLCGTIELAARARAQLALGNTLLLRTRACHPHARSTTHAPLTLPAIAIVSFLCAREGNVSTLV